MQGLQFPGRRRMRRRTSLRLEGAAGSNGQPHPARASGGCQSLHRGSCVPCRPRHCRSRMKAERPRHDRRSWGSEESRPGQRTWRACRHGYRAPKQRPGFVSVSPAKLPRPARCHVPSLPSRDPVCRSGAAYARPERVQAPAASHCRDQSGHPRTRSGCEEETDLLPRHPRSAPPLPSGVLRNSGLRSAPWRLPSMRGRPGTSTGQRTCRARNPKNFAWIHDTTVRNSRHLRNPRLRKWTNVGNWQPVCVRRGATWQQRLSGPVHSHEIGGDQRAATQRLRLRGCLQSASARETGTVARHQHRIEFGDLK